MNFFFHPEAQAEFNEAIAFSLRLFLAVNPVCKVAEAAKYVFD